MQHWLLSDINYQWQWLLSEVHFQKLLNKVDYRIWGKIKSNIFIATPMAELMLYASLLALYFRALSTTVALSFQNTFISTFYWGW